MLFGFNTVDVLAQFIRPQSLASAGFGILVWLVGLTVIVLLWRKESSAYYQASGSR